MCDAVRVGTVVVWRVTERCDTACGFCAYDARLRRPRREADPGELLRVGALLAAWRRDVLLSFLGGEPFLWPPLVEVTAALRALGLRVGLTSNGRALAEPRWRRFCLESLDELTLSIDGPPEVHDALRGRRGLGAALLDALASLRAARRDGRPRLRVNSVLMRDTAARYPELAAALATVADELTVNALGARDRPEFAAGRTLRPADLVAARLRVGAAYRARLDASARGVPLPADDCPVVDRFLFVEVDGRVAPCSYSLDARGVALGELRTVADLDDLPRRFARARAAACDDCPSTQAHGKFLRGTLPP